VEEGKFPLGTRKFPSLVSTSLRSCADSRSNLNRWISNFLSRMVSKPLERFENSKGQTTSELSSQHQLPISTLPCPVSAIHSATLVLLSFTCPSLLSPLLLPPFKPIESTLSPLDVTISSQNPFLFLGSRPNSLNGVR